MYFFGSHSTFGKNGILPVHGYCYSIIFNLFMLKYLKQAFIAKVIGVFLLIGLCLGGTCPKGQIYHHQQCVSCSLIPNTIDSSNKVNSCICVSGYQWSQKQFTCIKMTNLRSDYQIESELENYQQEEDVEGSPRLLAIACDTTKGFIFKNNMCVNCKDITWSNGLAKDVNTCYCQAPYIWNAYYQVCGCYIENTNTLYINGSSCNVCNQISISTTSSQCILCNGGTFGYSLFGCVNCSSIPYGTGATASTVYGMCNCQTGYTFNLWLGACVCNMASQYVITSANTCQACSSLPAASISACISCSASFFYSGYVCRASSLVGNYNTTTNGCPTNYVLTTNPVTNQTTGCVCSSAAGYYTNASICKSCTTSPIAGIAAATCTSCSVSAGFFLTAKECIYCPNAPYSTATATVSGCLCQANYYWSAVTSSCLCDWTIDYYGTAGSCISCSSLSNTVSPATATGCSCVAGYAWNGTQCVCNPSNGAFISTSGQCINCNTINGALPIVASGGNSCTCIVGRIWNATQQTCVCDYTQNFWLINGVCYDCTAVANTNGAASSSGCQCGQGLTWINSENMCDCPAGYVNMGTYCGSCSVITLPTGATVAGCQVCNVSQGFFLSGGICYACSKQKYTTGAATSTGCTCTNSSLVWVTALGSCTCTFTIGYTTTIVSGSLSCVACSGLSCSCGYPGTGTIYNNGICTNCVGVPNSSGVATSGICVCLPGYAFSGSVYPYSCYCSIKLGYYMSSTCLNCATLPATGTVTSSGCQICSYSQGFLYLSNDTCIQCSSLPGASGVATATGCGCSTGVWNSVLFQCVNVTCSVGYIYSSQNMQCVCNPSTSITSGTTCILCSSIANSTGVPLNSTACICNVNFAWTASSSGVGSCVSLLNCNSTTSVLIGTVCINCSTILFSTGPVSGTSNCSCPTALVWVFTTSTSTGACACSNLLQIPSTNGTSCVCNSVYAIASTTTVCFDCRTVAYSTNTTVSGSCGCLTNFIWNSTTQTCLCPTPFVISGGLCICNSTTSVMIGSLCFNCLTVTFSTGAAPGTSNCTCPAAFVWVYTASTNSGSCICSNSLQIPSTNGSSCICNPTYAIISASKICLDCRTVLYSTNLTVAGVCGCLANFVWNSTSQSCVCSTPFVLSGGQCVCDLTVSIMIGTLCYDCLTVPLSTGPALGTSNCLCPSTLSWVFNTLTSSGACACTNALQIPSTNGSSCLCNPAYAISSITTVCFDCRTVLYSSNSTVNGLCGCLNNFAWNSTSLSCGCPSPYIISGGQCICNPITTVTISGGCFICSNDPNSTGVSSGTACICQAYMMWNGTACVSDCNSTSVYVVNSTNATAYSCVNCGSNGTYTLAVVNATSCSCSGSNLVWNILGYCDCGTTSAMIITGTTYACVVCNSAIYSTGRSTSYTCACPAPLTWNPTTKACDCGSSAVVAYINLVYSCVVCNSSIYAASKLNINTCNCISTSFVWSSSTYQCSCATANSVIFLSTAGTYSCVTCNSTIYSVSALSATTCSCTSSLFVWAPNVGCICSSSSTIVTGTGTTATCLVCNSTIYSVSIYNSTTCNCVSTALIWSSSTNQCGCAAANTVISLSSTGVYGCVTCNSSIYAVSMLTSTSCNCVSTSFVWSSSTYQCSCAILNNVVFVSSVGVYSCVTCNSTIYAVASLSSTTCSCISSLFVWSPNVGCVCSNAAAIIVGSGTTATCLVCNSTIYSSGKSSTSNACVCLGSLTWQGTACGCASPLVILSNNTCGAATVTCATTLVLLPNNTCTSCTSTIYALSRLNATNCNCLSAALVWNPTAGTCKCSSSLAIIFVVGSTYTCLTCNATVYAAGPATTTTCACLSPSLTWNTTSGTCGCSVVSIIYAQGTNYSCVLCNSAVYAVNRLNITTCNCIDTTFSWTGTNCSCPAGSIIGANFKCLVCPTGVIINNLICNCSTAASPYSIWNDITKTCVACGTSAVPNSVAGFFGVACQCVAGYIWDVMTNTCIVSCPSTGCTITCNKISYTSLTLAALPVTSVTVRNIVASASATIQAFYLAAGSDYSSINSMACPCSSGMYWNSITMRCYSLSFNLV